MSHRGKKIPARGHTTIEAVNYTDEPSRLFIAFGGTFTAASIPPGATVPIAKRYFPRGHSIYAKGAGVILILNP